MGAWIWLCAAILAGVNLFTVVVKIEVLQERTRAWLKSFAGGVSVAYAIIDLLPSLAEAQTSLPNHEAGPALLAEHHVYLVVLLGIIIFYGLEVLARRSCDYRGIAEGAGKTDSAVFWIHIGAFAIYNAIVGALLVFEKAASLEGLLWFTVAMTFHFFVNDMSLQEHHRATYRRIGRWVMAAAVFVGCGAATFVGARSLSFIVLSALVAGGIIMNVFKEELPAQKSVCFSAFCLGSLGFATVLLAATK